MWPANLNSYSNLKVVQANFIGVAFHLSVEQIVSSCESIKVCFDVDCRLQYVLDLRAFA